MKAPTVFISYSHDSREHEDRVLDLADRLVADGIDVILDQYEAAPPEGWPRWMDQHIRDADFVLLLCTGPYYRRVMGEEAPGVGRGVRWEGNLIYQHLYDADTVNRRFIPVLLAGGDPEHIPAPLRGVAFYRLDTEEGYEALYRRLTDQPLTLKPRLGKLRRLPPRQRREMEGAAVGGDVRGVTTAQAPDRPPNASPVAESGWNAAAIRELLTASFNDEELTTLCFDHFLVVYEDFSVGMSKGQKVQRLLDHVLRHGRVDDLVACVRRANPTQYARFVARLEKQGVRRQVSEARLRLRRPQAKLIWGVVGLLAVLSLLALGVAVGPSAWRALQTAPMHYSGARPPAMANVGDTWARPVDGMVMVYVPAGEFLMGSSNADAQAYDNEKPQHTVYLDGFWIDRTEVTNDQYRLCVEAGACLPLGCGADDLVNAPDQPVVCVSWNDAQAYAAWAEGRLPTEAEWEKAARGSDGRIYPWGNDFDASRLNFCDRNCSYDWRDTNANDGYTETAPVGSYPGGASPYGALDMAGNVWEWTQSLFAAYPYDPADGREDLAGTGARVCCAAGRSPL